LRIRLKAADNNFLFYLAIPATAVVAREVVEAYRAQVGNHPVGTGPFMVGEWKHSDRITLLANRAFRPAQFQGRQRLPLLDRIDIKIAEEFQGAHAGFPERRIRLPGTGAGIDDRNGADRRRQADAAAGAGQERHGAVAASPCCKPITCG
jgi:MarR-like DNA-binding transcriptional regulator SgrR of sgrS sRNA